MYQITVANSRSKRHKIRLKKVFKVANSSKKQMYRFHKDLKLLLDNKKENKKRIQ